MTRLPRVTGRSSQQADGLRLPTKDDDHHTRQKSDQSSVGTLHPRTAAIQSQSATNLLRRDDPCIKEILFKAAFCSVYVWSAADKLWLKPDVEGFFYVVRRKVPSNVRCLAEVGDLEKPRQLPPSGTSIGNAGGIPQPELVQQALRLPPLRHDVKFRIVVVNQRMPVNLVEDITQDWELNVVPNYIFYRCPIGTGENGAKKKKTMGIWFYSDEEKAAAARQIREVTDASPPRHSARRMSSKGTDAIVMQPIPRDAAADVSVAVAGLPSVGDGRDISDSREENQSATVDLRDASSSVGSQFHRDEEGVRKGQEIMRLIGGQGGKAAAPYLAGEDDSLRKNARREPPAPHDVKPPTLSDESSSLAAAVAARPLPSIEPETAEGLGGIDNGITSAPLEPSSDATQASLLDDPLIDVAASPTRLPTEIYPGGLLGVQSVDIYRRALSGWNGLNQNFFKGVSPFHSGGAQSLNFMTPHPMETAGRSSCGLSSSTPLLRDPLGPLEDKGAMSSTRKNKKVDHPRNGLLQDPLRVEPPSWSLGGTLDALLELMDGRRELAGALCSVAAPRDEDWRAAVVEHFKSNRSFRYSIARAACVRSLCRDLMLSKGEAEGLLSDYPLAGPT